MGILRNYINNGVPVANRIKFESNNKPLVVKNVPLVADAKVPTYTTEASRRLTDLERVAKLMIKPEGLKFLANNAALKQLQFKTDPNKTAAGRVLQRVGQGLADTAKLVGSTLAQVPVNGTGVHFVQSFAGIKGTYLEEKGVIKQGGVPPHVVVSPGFAPIFIKDGSEKDKQLTGKVDIPTLAIRANETSGPNIIGPDNQEYTTIPQVGTYLVGFDGQTGDTEKVAGVPKAINTKIGSAGPDSDIIVGDPEDALANRINLGDPGLQISTDTDTEKNLKPLRQDKLNLLGPTSTDVNGTQEARDLIKFRFEIITPGESNENPKSKHLYFRAYLDNFSDGFSSKWSGFNYVGRGETFYTYGGMDRSINVGFKIAAQSAEEMRPLYQKINVLASAVAPTYENNFMRGTLAKLTVGDYVYRQPGFIEKVDFQWDQEYPWEIAMNAPEGLARDIPHQELPMILDVSVAFKPIHNFLPTSEYTLASKEDALAGKGTLTGPRYISNGRAPLDDTPSKNRYINDE